MENESELMENDDSNDEIEDIIDSNLVDSSNNQLIDWENGEDSGNDCDEKIYEDLCYVTISSTFPNEVFIK